MKLLLDEDQVGVVTSDGQAEMYWAVRKDGTEEKELRPVEGYAAEHGINSVGFPNVVTCQGVLAVMENGTLIATHVPNSQTETLLLQKMNEVIALHGGPEAIKHLYVASNKDKLDPSYGMDTAGKASALGFEGKARYVDTSKLKLHQEGAYVQFTPMSGADGKCLVEGKRDRRMEYQSAKHTVSNDAGKVRQMFVKREAELKPDATTMHTLKSSKVKV